MGRVTGDLLSLSDETLIDFANVTKTYRPHSRVTAGLKNAVLHWARSQKDQAGSYTVTALKEVSFRVKRGESFGIIGKNGSGKSTTLALIAGVMRPSSGHVRVGARVSPLLELGAGFHPELTGRNNIVLNGVLLGMTKRVVMARMEEIVEFSGLGEFIDRPLRTYSSGMVARLGFSVVVHLEPELLLIDEVLAVGDAEFSQKCTIEIEKIKNSGTTVVLVSHDVASVQRLCDRAALLEQGHLSFVGPAAEAVALYCATPESARLGAA